MWTATIYYAFFDLSKQNTRQGFGLVGLERSVPVGCLGSRGPEDVVPIKQAGLWIRIRMNLH
jgi:hypothetical protein